MRFLVLFFLLIACGNAKQNHQIDSSDISRLKDKYLLYLSLLSDSKRFYGAGWLTDDCDALLMNSLAATSGVTDIDIESAKNKETNQWFRTPGKDCLSSGRSDSTISRDMFSGLYYWLYKYKRSDLTDEIINFGERNKNAFGFWIMGEGEPTKIDIRYNLQATFYELRYKLGGIDSNGRKYPQLWSKNTGDFETHLQFLHIYFRSLLNDEISKYAFEVIKHHAKNQPRNALFNAIYAMFSDENFDKSIAVLLDNSLFPDDRLPTNKEYCTDYLWQRDQHKQHDWQPCNINGDKVRGIDFIFASAIILGRI